MKTTIVLGVLFAAARIWMGFTVEPTQADLTDVFKDAVHLYMGGLAVSIWYDRRDRLAWKGDRHFFWQRWLFWSLCAVEVAMATFQRI